MPITQHSRIAPCAALCVALLLYGHGIQAVAAERPGTGPAPDGASNPGTAACAAAAGRGDVAAARALCAPGRAAGNAVDGYNLALALWQSAPDEARTHLQWAADRGLAEATHLLGNLALDNGDAETGRARLEAAARAGLALAQFDYATALLERDAHGDRTEAVRWYGRAAAGGENAARYNLAVLLLGGRLGDTRPLLAWAWLSSLDAMDSHAEVLRLASELAGQMNREERARAVALLEAVRDDPVNAAEQLAREVEALAAPSAAPAQRSDRRASAARGAHS